MFSNNPFDDILFNFDVKLIEVIRLQFLKTYFPKTVTLSGMFTLDKPVFSKAQSRISFKPLGNFKSVNFVQFLNEESPNTVTLSGICTLDKPVFSNILSLILSIFNFDGKNTYVNRLQFLNMPVPIDVTVSGI